MYGAVEWGVLMMSWNQFIKSKGWEINSTWAPAHSPLAAPTGFRLCYSTLITLHKLAIIYYLSRPSRNSPCQSLMRKNTRSKLLFIVTSVKYVLFRCISTKDEHVCMIETSVCRVATICSEFATDMLFFWELHVKSAFVRYRNMSIHLRSIHQRY